MTPLLLRLTKALAMVSVALLLAPVLAFFAYDALVFQPRRDDIEAILAQADPQDRTPPPAIRAFIAATHREGASAAFTVGRQLHFRFLPRKSNLVWQARGFLWERLVSLHLSDDEIAGLYAALAANGEGQGMNALAQRLFAKPLDSLSDEEAATVVAYTWAPSVYERSPARLVERRDRLIAEARVGG